MDVTGIPDYIKTQYNNTTATNAANGATKSIGGISETSSREEIEEAVKSFEGYFVEQMIKEMKKSVDNINDDEDSSTSMYTDYFMDGTISKLASDLVDQLGGNITDDFVDQIMRNYGIDAKEETAE